ncbi:MAG: DNA (cytosine-5-)-methyltransferase [Methylovulum sp.]|nr:DNA (cytosine-5-)-methyltransferase [Methylovulum sp.]
MYNIEHNYFPSAGCEFPPPEIGKFRFIDLFAGIGGFRLAMQSVGGECVFSSEWNKDSQTTYFDNFGELPAGDITNISENDIPDHDVLCAGFPCQPFSLAGVSARNSLNTAHGFACETQGTLFFDVMRIVAEKRPSVIFLENVKNLVRHDKGNTFSVIKSAIEELGYSFSYALINAQTVVPQKRVRCYIVCLRDSAVEFEFPDFRGEPIPLNSILDDNVSDTFTISDRLWAGHQRRTATNLARGVGFTAFCVDIEKPANTLVARYWKDGKECLIPQQDKNPRMLTPRECARLQGYPESFKIPVSKSAAYRQFGNSVALPVIKKIAEKIFNHLAEEKKCSLEPIRN